MKWLSPAARLRAFCCFSVAALAIPLSAASGQEWSNNVEYASETTEAPAESAGDCLDSEFGGCHCQSQCYSPGGSFKARLEAMAKSMAQQGIVYDVVGTQFYQGVTSGGIDEGFEYGGKVDQFIILDGGKLGLCEGSGMSMHVETRFGDDVNRQAVGLAPVNVAMLYPNEGEHDTAITGLTFTQFLSDDLQAAVGKFNALDLFYSLYPQTGRGVNGFMNASMVIPIGVARVAQLSFMGAGLTLLEDKQAKAGILVFDNQNVTTTSGFHDMFENGANILGFWKFFHDIDGLTGSQMVGGIWATGQYASLDPTSIVIEPDNGIVATQVGGAYSLLYIVEQKLWMDCCNPNRNISFISQWALSDEETSPFGWSCNAAIQGTGLVGSRPQDSFGVGYFHTGLSSDFKALLAPVLDLQDINGVELYYNAAVTDCFHLTSDLQVIEPAEVANDTCVVFGLRGTIGL